MKCIKAQGEYFEGQHVGNACGQLLTITDFDNATFEPFFRVLPFMVSPCFLHGIML